ncbi:MAG: dihydroorotase [Clostridia bacterium]|nr:dihydroorotase [Clostridia bacterium]
MNAVFSRATIFKNGRFEQGGEAVAKTTSFDSLFIDSTKYIIFPGFADMHVHFREPGFSYKETIVTGNASAKHAGYTTVCTMPNLNPTPDSLENLKAQLELIKAGADIRVLPFGSITKGELGKELADLEAMAPFVCGYSDDGRGVDDRGLMKEAMQRARALDKLISAHCEDGTQIKDSHEAEWKQIERDIKLVDEIKCKYHVCHISTKESVALIREAKKSGVNITCETAPHYLTLSQVNVRDEGGFRMNPPLREEEDRLALVEGLIDGTIDVIATDHAPHSAEEKSKGLKSLNGIVGLETAFPILYTRLVKEGVISLERLVELMAVNPYDRLGIAPNGFTVYSLDEEYTINPNDFKTKGRSTPYGGERVFGKCLATVCDGSLVYIDNNILRK